MRFIDAVNQEAVGRSLTRLALASLSITSLVFALLLAMDLSREPIVIDRACESRLAGVSGAGQTKEEIQAFLEAALRARFETAPPVDPSAYLSQELLVSRAREQDELKTRGLEQRIVFRGAAIDSGRYALEADRVIAAGGARSAIVIRLFAKIASKSRSLTNPYGLVLTALEQQKEEPKHE
jgi:hypothetical protein